MMKSMMEVAGLASVLGMTGGMRRLAALPGMRSANVKQGSGSATVPQDETRKSLQAIPVRWSCCTGRPQQFHDRSLHDVEPMARLPTYGIDAAEPAPLGLPPAAAVRQTLGRAGWRIGDIERTESSVAFSAIVLGIVTELGISEWIVEAERIAIPLSHPIGERGAIRTTPSPDALCRNRRRRAPVRRGASATASTLRSSSSPFPKEHRGANQWKR